LEQICSDLQQIIAQYGKLLVIPLIFCSRTNLSVIRNLITLLSLGFQKSPSDKVVLARLTLSILTRFCFAPETSYGEQIKQELAQLVQLTPDQVLKTFPFKDPEIPEMLETQSVTSIYSLTTTGSWFSDVSQKPRRELTLNEVCQFKIFQLRCLQGIKTYFETVEADQSLQSQSQTGFYGKLAIAGIGVATLLLAMAKSGAGGSVSSMG